MKHVFEIFVVSDHITHEHWEALRRVLNTHLGSFAKVDLIFWCKDNVVRYFIASDKDLGSLSSNLDSLIVRPVEATDLPNIHASRSVSGIQLVANGNLLDNREKYAIKKAINLEYAVFNIRFLGPEKTYTKCNLYFVDPSGHYVKSTKLMTNFPSRLLSANFSGTTRYLKPSLPKYLNIEKSLHMLVSDSHAALFRVDTFPYLMKDYYLQLTGYDFDRHSFIIGASGSGKSKLISLLVDRLYHTGLRMNYRVIVIDPHAAIAEDFSQIEQRRIITFGMQDGTSLFPGAGTDLTSATELTATLFRSVMGDQFNARLDRLLRYSLFTLMTAQTMTLANLKRFLTDAEYRIQVSQHVAGYVPENVTKFFGADFNEIRTQYYETTILPLVTMVDEMQLQPSLVGESETSLAKVIQENFLTVFSLNKVSMGEKVVKTVAGLLIQQIFLLAQARAFGQKIILVIDEVSVVQNPAIAQILAEARKFNLTVILTQQYFGQVEKQLRDAIFANVFNYYAFKVSEEDARALEGNLNIELPKSIIEAEKVKGVSLSELKVKLMTELHPRQCLVRVMSNGQIAPAIKATTMDAPIPLTNILGSRRSDVHNENKVLPKKFVERANNVRTTTRLPRILLRQIMSDDQSTTSKPANHQSLQSILSIQSSSKRNTNGKEHNDTP